MSEDSASRLLVIGYGNELRCDDGLGPRIARAIDGLQLHGVQVLTAHQLTPELAHPISLARAVVFVDAAVGARAPVQLCKIECAPGRSTQTHVMSPPGLLALAIAVYRRAPPAWWLTASAADLSFSPELSEKGQAVRDLAVQRFRQLWELEFDTIGKSGSPGTARSHPGPR